jgi:hypothetical protein
MQTPISCHARILWGLALCALLLPIAARTTHARAAATPAPHVSVLYVVSHANFTACTSAATASTCEPHPRQSLPVGATSIQVFFVYDHARAHRTRYQFVIYVEGTPITRGSETLPTTGQQAFENLGDNPPLTPGLYRIDMLLDGALAASTSFIVGTPTTLRFFYSTTPAGAAAFARGDFAPMTTAFPVGTSTIDFVYGYQGAKAGVTHYRVAVIDQSSTLVDSRQVIATAAADGGSVALTLPSAAPGYYVAQVWASRVVLAEVMFSIGAPGT